MAIKIPLLTEFDPKGLKQANAAFGKLATDVSSLGRNFAVLGAGIVAGTALLGKAVMSASNFEAEFEGVNQVFKDAAGSVQAFAEQASASAGLSATEALQAAKTFGLFATGAGLGVDAAADFSTTMVQLAGDLGSFNDVPTAEALAAIQSGLMGQAEPLRKFGVFLDDATLKAEALNMGIYNGTGPLDTQQKMMASYSAILAQTTIQQGDFVKYGDTLGNSLKTISSDFDNLTREIGMMLIPAITAAMPEIKAMADSIGTQLKTAIESIDWASLINALVGIATFFISNGEAILYAVGALFALNTIYKTVVIATGIVNTAMALSTWFFAQFTAGVSLSTIALKTFRTALITTGVGAIIVGLGFVAEWMMNSSAATDDAADSLDNYSDSIPDEFKRPMVIPPPKVPDMPKMPDMPGGPGSPSGKSDPMGIQAWLADSQREAEIASKRIELIGRGLSEAVTDSILSASDPLGAANDALFLIATGGLANINMLTDAFNRSAAGQQFAAEQARKAAEEAQRVAEEAAAREQALLEKRKNAFESFNNSVKSLFGQIKSSILSSFDLPTLGNSVNSITRNIAKLLERTKSFATNISQLSGMGLNSALLQQVIQAGPMAGSALAQALVGGGGAFIGQLNQAYGEFGDIASGIAGTGTRSAFENPSVVNNYNIEVNGGVGSGPSIGKAIVDAIKSYERTSGAVWQGA